MLRFHIYYADLSTSGETLAAKLLVRQNSSVAGCERSLRTL